MDSRDPEGTKRRIKRKIQRSQSHHPVFPKTSSALWASPPRTSLSLYFTAVARPAASWSHRRSCLFLAVQAMPTSGKYHALCTQSTMVSGTEAPENATRLPLPFPLLLPLPLPLGGRPPDTSLLFCTARSLGVASRLTKAPKSCRECSSQ